MAAPSIPEEHLDLTEKLYLSARTERSIQILLCKKLGITGRTARRYIRRVKDRLASRHTKNPGAARVRAESMLLESYKLAKNRERAYVVKHGEISEVERVADPDARTMALAAERLAALHDAAGAQKHEHSGPNGGPIETVAKVALLPVIDDPADLADDVPGDIPADAAPSEIPGKSG